MRGSSQQFMGIPGPQKILKTFGSLWLSQTSNENRNPRTSSSCPTSEISCLANYHGQDTCCFNYPGGQMLQTQFWDVDPALGPEDAWTIHGLWWVCTTFSGWMNIQLTLVGPITATAALTSSVTPDASTATFLWSLLTRAGETCSNTWASIGRISVVMITICGNMSGTSTALASAPWSQIATRTICHSKRLWTTSTRLLRFIRSCLPMRLVWFSRSMTDYIYSDQTTNNI